MLTTYMNSEQKHLHVTGICGVGTSALAIAFHKKGWKVTGSDKGFFPPVSTNLEQAGISFYAGWHPEKMIENGAPDLIMAGGGGASPNNPEIIYAREHSIPVLSMAEVIGKYMVRENSIVVTGTWGKTTISSLLSFIALKSGIDPTYFTGGISLSHDTGALSDSKWSIVEGDEYQAAIWDRQAKFNYYSPTHLILTSVSWDHADLYPTEEEYFNAFRKLISHIPARGVILACKDDMRTMEFVSTTNRTAPVITYGGDSSADYAYHSIRHTKDSLSFSVTHKDTTFTMSSPMLGRFNVQNIAACFAMAHHIGIPAEKIISAILEFKGIKRRLERRLEGKLTVLDCHAPTPEKARSVIESIREVYTKKLLVIFEPNIGGRQKNSSAMYDNTFREADCVLIPRLTKLKVAENIREEDKALEGNELRDIIARTHQDVRYIEDDEALIAAVLRYTEENDTDAIAFLGSHGFRGMIEAVIARFS
jgi:UDP-N-acetylmuramate: L-alanyl-gamma-D-glutamyl-meso-diaminopimelate ligase